MKKLSELLSSCCVFLGSLLWVGVLVSNPLCPPVAGPYVLPLISKTFSHLAQIHGSLFTLACQSTSLLAAERLVTSSSASLKLLIRDCTKYRRPSRQSGPSWTRQCALMWPVSAFNAPADGWNLCVRMQRWWCSAACPRTIHSGCTERSLHAPRCFWASSEGPAPHLALARMWHTARPARSVLWSMSSARIAPPCFTHCRRVIHRTSPNQFDRHDLTVLSFKLPNTWHLCCARYLRITDEHLELLDSQRSEHFILRVWRELYLHEVQHPCSDRQPHELLRVRLFRSHSQLELHFELRSAECNAFCSAGAESRRYSLRSDCSQCEMLSRTGPWCRSADFYVREHVPNIVDGNWYAATLAVNFNSKPLSHSKV